MGSGSKLVLLACACTIALALSASSAAANNYCVGMVVCPGANIEPNIQVALDAAGTTVGADNVYIGLLGSPYTGDWVYNYPTETVSIIGVGATKPILQTGLGGLRALRVSSTSSAHVQHLELQVPNVNGGVGLAWSGTADDVSVTHSGSGALIHALTPYGDATLVNSQANIDGGGSGYAVDLQSATGFTMRDTTVVSHSLIGLYTPTAISNVILQRVAITANTAAIEMAASGSDITSQQLFVRATNSGSTNGVIALLGGNTIDIDHATIVGDGDGRGVEVQGGPGANSSAQITNSLVANVAVSGLAAATGGKVGALGFSYSMLGSAPTTSAGGSATMGPGAIIGAPTFVDPAGGDFHLKAPQQAIDIADSADTTTLDLSNKPRIVDGDGNGSVRSDLGAFEYQRSTPVPAITSPPLSQNVAATFSAAGSTDADPGDTLTYAWSFGDGTTGSGVSPSHTYATDGAKTVSLTATDQLGLAGTTTAQVNVLDKSFAFTVAKPKPNKKGTSVAYKISCPASEKSCTIKLAIASKSKVTTGGASGKKKIRALAKPATIVVTGGTAKSATLKLNKTALKLIKRGGKLKTKTTFVGSDAAGNTKKVVQNYVAKKGKK
jgi:PKD repeat protein